MQRGRCLRVGPPSSIYQRELLEQFFRLRSPWSLALRRPRVRFYRKGSCSFIVHLTPRQYARTQSPQTSCSEDGLGDPASIQITKKAVAAARL